MCGIAGVIANNNLSPDAKDIVAKMNDIQKHRGPDDEGVFCGETCVLGHRRLAIIDLSKDGHQPFISNDQRYVLVYNGEIYNYIELKAELEASGEIFKTKTDTEVLLKCYQRYGQDCLKMFNGMFAFAIYDTQDKSLFLARDRFGIKPLYYMLHDSKLYFASETKALRSIKQLNLSVREQSVFDFLVFNRTDIFDETFFNEIQRIPKGHCATFNKKGLTLETWWDPCQYKGNRNGEGLLEEIDNIFLSALTLRMRSDVPVGSCLSGGLDSSMITGALYAKNLAKENFATFTASFPGDPIDETRYIEALNRKYLFKNFKTFPSSNLAYENLKDFVYTIDEPSSDASFYSQYEVMRLARNNGITVLLDGQGGDENFAGYQYFHGFYMHGLLRKKRFLKFICELTQVILRGQHHSAYQTLGFELLNDSMRKDLLKKAVPFVRDDFFNQYIDSSRIYKEFFDAEDLNTSLVRHFQYKLEHLLRLEDRTSMAFAIEARVPYLDHRLVETLLAVDEDIKIKGGETKHLQKKALEQYTIPEILNRKDKIGFGTPLDEWMKTSEWTQLTKDNMEQLQETFGHIFKKVPGIPKEGQQRWKINQLATWQKIISQ